MTMHHAQRIIRNTAWFTVGSVLQKIISFGYFTLIAMTVGVEGTGQYFFALTYAALFAVAADWGITPVLTREIARDRGQGTSYIAQGFVLKFAFTIITVSLMIFLAVLLGYTKDTRDMIALAAAVMALDSVHLGGYAILRGLQRVHYEAIGLVLGQISLAVSGIVVLSVFGGLAVDTHATPIASLPRPIAPVVLLLPYLVASVVNTSIAAIGCIRQRITIPKPATIRLLLPTTWLLRTATPFAIAGGLARIYTYSDTILLSLLASSLAVGYYSTPFKIAFAFQFIPLAFMGALYPAMSAASTRAPERLAPLFEQAIRILLTIVLPIACGIGILAEPIILQLYGPSYAPSVTPLRLLMAALPFIFANFPAGNLLNAVDRQAMNTKLLGLATTVNIIANMLLIPMYGATGAALGALLASVTLFSANLTIVHRVAPYRLRVIGKAALQTGTAALLMSIAIAPLQSAPLLTRVLIGVVVYAGALLLIGGIRLRDLTTLFSAFRRNASRSTGVLE